MVIELYEPNVQFKQIILLDKKNGLVGEYALPLLITKQVLSSKSEFTNYHTVLKKMVLEKQLLGDTAVFWVDGVPREAGVWRLDIVESLLIRHARGFLLEEVEIQ